MGWGISLDLYHERGGLRLTNQFNNRLFELESKLVIAEGQIVFSREKKDIFSPAADGGDPCIIKSDIALGECAADLGEKARPVCGDQFHDRPLSLRLITKSDLGRNSKVADLPSFSPLNLKISLVLARQGLPQPNGNLYLPHGVGQALP